jgi:hypothetical protein
LPTLDRRAGAPSNPRVYALRTVPEVAVAFWITKILTTGMARSASPISCRRCSSPSAWGRYSRSDIGHLMVSRADIADERV